MRPGHVGLLGLVLSLAVLVVVPGISAELCVRNKTKVKGDGKVVLRGKIFRSSEGCSPGSASVLDLAEFADADAQATQSGRIDALTGDVESLRDSLNPLRLANVVTVGKNGGDFSSVGDALESIVDAAEDKPYLVSVGPGVFAETDLLKIPSFVHVRGAGSNVTVLLSARSSSTDARGAAAVELLDGATLSDVHVVNDTSATPGENVFGVLLQEGTVPTFHLDAENRTLVERVRISAVGNEADVVAGIYGRGGVGTIRDSVATARGDGGQLRVALYLSDGGRILVEQCKMQGSRQGAGPAYAVVGINASAVIRGSLLVGSDTAAYAAGTSGMLSVQQCVLQNVNAEMLMADAGTRLTVVGSQFFGGATTAGGGTIVCTYNTSFLGTAVDCS